MGLAFHNRIVRPINLLNFAPRLLASLIALLAVASASHASNSERWTRLTDTVFTHIVRESELPATSGANTVVEDGDGFIWVGMQAGLARWDGYRFKVYQPDTETSGSLPDNFINALHTDPQGRLWIGTNSAGLARYDSTSDRFISYDAGPDGLSDSSVNAIIDDGAGGLWIGTGAGLDRLDLQSGLIRHHRHDKDDSSSLPGRRVLALHRDHSDTLWIGTSGGLARMGQGANGFTSVAVPTSSRQAANVISLFEDSEGRMWIGTGGHGAYIADRNGTVRPVAADPAIALDKETVRTIAEIRPGIVWIGTDSHGIVEVDASTGAQIKNIVHEATLPSSLGEGAVYVVYIDRAGLAWVGTDRRFSRHDATQTAVSTIFGATHGVGELTDADVAAALAMPDGRVWLGLGKGVDVVEPVSGGVVSFRPDPEQPERALPRAFITALAQVDQHVYIGTRKGMYRADSGARHLERVAVPGRSAAGDVATLLLDRGVLWIGGKPGLHALDIAGGNGARIQLAVAARLTDERVNTLGRGPDGSLWVGTENGLNRIDFERGTVESVGSHAAPHEGKSLGLVTAIHTDRTSRLWVATFGAGISVMTVGEAGATFLIQRVGAAQGLRNSNINQLLEDTFGRIWASTDDGIAVIDPESFAVRMLHSADGVSIRSYWAGSGAHIGAGELVFGGLGGLTLIRPEQFKTSNYRPPVVVTNVRVGGKSVTANRFNSPTSSGPLTVTAQANSLAVEFAALDYSAPELVRYEYRLEGYDEDWIEADPNQRLAAYTNLSPGTYALRLRGITRNGIATQMQAPVPIRVMPAWFQTSGFRILLTLAGMGLLAAIIHMRTAYLHHRRRELEREVADRTRELRESQRQLETIAYFDALTHLPNRRRFKDEMSGLIARKHEDFALLLIDLDRFKQINDTLGHEAGDQLLQEAASRFSACVSEGDILARLGGDEFVVLLPHSHPAERAAVVAHEILSALARPFLLVGQEFRVTGSIGICTYPNDGLDDQTLMKRADMAMYQAKAEGKNNFQFYSDSLSSNSFERLTLESGLRHALEHGEFHLRYQAKRDIVTGQMSGMEALLCWHSVELGNVEPHRFVPVAEETGLIIPIGKWALRTACLQNVTWQRQGLPRLSIAVNLTARQFCDERLLEDIASILDETGMDAHLLELEISEHVMMRDVERTVHTLTALKSMGVRIAIDNFGAGYSSLTTLQRFPLDTIKVDRSFISDITNLCAGNPLTDAVIAMGRSLSLTVVAEGVETREQAEVLRQHACDELQGFYFNRPLPADKFGELLHAQAAGVTYVGSRAALVNAV
jgi:diguanylate cyclase (GGDEF)-like protein